MTPEERCSNCQKILYYTFGYYKQQRTKRLLRHKIGHLCHRYFEYRRQCLASILPKVELISVDMEHAIPTGDYKPFISCERIKECDKGQSPLPPTTSSPPPSLMEVHSSNSGSNSSSLEAENKIHSSGAAAMRK